MKERCALFALLAATALVLAACAPSATPAPTAVPAATQAPQPTEAPQVEPTEAEPMVGETYVIGFSASITGPGSSLGEPERNTAEMIAAQLTEQGGVTGPDGVVHPVEVIIYDDESNPDTGVSVIRRLIEEDNVQVIVAGTLSGNSLAMVPVVTEAQVPYVSMASARSIILDPATGETHAWSFKTPQENVHSAVWQALYLKAIGISQVCHLYENTSYGADTNASAKVAFEPEGIQIVYEATFERTDTEFGAQMAGVQASGCEAVVVGSIPPGASTVTVALRDFVPDLPVIHGHGTCNLDFINLAGGAAEGVVSPCGRLFAAETLPDDDPQKPVLLQYIHDYTEFTNGAPISTFGGHGWDGMMWAVEALASLEDGMSLADQRAAIRDYIESNISGWPGTGGVFNITADDHLGLTYEALTFVKVEGGTWLYFPQSEW